jgi:hypothetical protein
MTTDDLINTVVELRVAMRLLNSERSDEAAEILRNVSSWLIEKAKDISVRQMHEEWLTGDALLDSARARVDRIEDHLSQARLRG